VSAVAHIDDYKAGKFFSEEFRGDMSWNGYEHNVLLRNLGPDETGVPRYADVAMALGADGMLDARGIAVFDYDNDGDLDVAINHNPGDNDREWVPVSLLENRSGSSANALTVALVGTTANRDAVGARVTAVIGDLRMTRLIGGSSYASQHDDRAHFGLADHDRVDTLIVRWPGGGEARFEDIAAGAVRIVEGRGLEPIDLPRFTEAGPIGGAR